MSTSSTTATPGFVTPPNTPPKPPSKGSGKAPTAFSFDASAIQAQSSASSPQIQRRSVATANAAGLVLLAEPPKPPIRKAVCEESEEETEPYKNLALGCACGMTCCSCLIAALAGVLFFAQQPSKAH